MNEICDQLDNEKFGALRSLYFSFFDQDELMDIPVLDAGLLPSEEYWKKGSQHVFLFAETYKISTCFY